MDRIDMTDGLDKADRAKADHKADAVDEVDRNARADKNPWSR